jgi:hypothetical protein
MSMDAFGTMKARLRGNSHDPFRSCSCCDATLDLHLILTGQNPRAVYSGCENDWRTFFVLPSRIGDGPQLLRTTTSTQSPQNE